MRILKRCESYDIVQWDFEGMPITFRFWKTCDVVEMRVNNFFARANGYESLEDMISHTTGRAVFDKCFGGVPKWIRVTREAGFVFVGRDRDTVN